MEDEQDCGYDFIEVFSGFDDAGPSYGRFCGNKVLQTFFNSKLLESLIFPLCIQIEELVKLKVFKYLFF